MKKIFLYFILLLTALLMLFPFLIMFLIVKDRYSANGSMDWMYNFIMASKRKITTKKPLSGNLRSHALNATKMTQKPNLQKKTIDGKKVIISAREAKKLK